MSEPEPADCALEAGKKARNERRKALATTLNAIGVAGLIPAIFQPFANGDVRAGIAATGLAVFVVTQVLLHYVLSRLED